MEYTIDTIDPKEPLRRRRRWLLPTTAVVLAGAAGAAGYWGVEADRQRSEAAGQLAEQRKQSASLAKTLDQDRANRAVLDKRLAACEQAPLDGSKRAAMPLMF